MQTLIPTEYRCAVCNTAVYRVVSDKSTSAYEYVRDCEHKNAAIVADMTAKCVGKGSLK
jgi:DNA-directed RNA polymerase subunit RPC12/RpoP